jgi:hypothetical protein
MRIVQGVEARQPLAHRLASRGSDYARFVTVQRPAEVRLPARVEA